MRITCAALLCLFLCVVFIGGVAQADVGGGSVSIAATPEKALESTYGGQNEMASAVANGANEFAFRLSAELVKGAGNQNFICSPYSVWIPLAALVNATDDAAKADLLAALGATGIRGEDINSAASRMLYDLTRESDRELATIYGEEYYHDPLRIANAIFVDHSVTLRQDFAQVFADYYRGSAMGVDFRSPAAVDAVNQWAGDNTDGLITDIVQEFSPDTAAAIANAIFFSDRWSWEFDPDKTEEDVFHAPDDESTALFMLREGDELDYYEDDRVQAILLEFVTDGGMYIILPKDGDGVGLLSSMTNPYFLEIARGTRARPGKLLLPRFSIEGDILQLRDALMALGVPLFDAEAAYLTGGLIEEDLPMWVSSVSHKAVIDLDEEGTTAAAVTVMAMGLGAAPPDEEDVPVPFEMICDKPFVFILYAFTYDGGRQVLFTGVVNQP